MKKIYVSQVTNEKLEAFKKAQSKGIHLPFVTATFMSAGTRSIFMCPVQKRVIAVMSQGEKMLYFTKIFNPNVIAIKEQYPLDYVKTQEIAKIHDVIHPRNPDTGELTVMTTDFLITYRDDDGTTYREAIAYKDHIPRNEHKRTHEKLDIEEQYWVDFGVSHDLIMRDDVCETEAFNLINLSYWYDKYSDPAVLLSFSKTFINKVIQYPSAGLRATIKHAAISLDIAPRNAQVLFANSVVRKILKVDIHQPIDSHLPVKLCLVDI
jgi:hypothetical protein